MSIQYDPTKVGQQAEILGGVHTSAILAKLYTNIPAGSTAYTSDVGPMVFNGISWVSQGALSSALQDMTPSPSPADRAILPSTQAFENGVMQEANVWYYNGFYHMIYSASWASSTLGYAYATTPKGPWTHLASPVIGNGAGGTTAGQFVAHTGLYIENNTVYIVSSIAGAGSAILWSAPINFVPASGPTFTNLGAIMAFPSGFNGWGNFQLIRQGPGAYALLAEARKTSDSVYRTGLATASGSLDSAPTFTPTTFPLTQLVGIITYWGIIGSARATTYGGPWTQDALGVHGAGSDLVTLYYHSGPRATSPTDIFRAVSPLNDLVNWTSLDNGYPVFRRALVAEVNQVADPSLIPDTDGAWLLFSSAVSDLDQTSVIVVTPALAGAHAPNTGAMRQKATDNYAQRTLSAPVYLDTSVTAYQALNGDDIAYNLGINNLAVALPRATWGAIVRISAFNGLGTGHTVTVSRNASDFFNWNGASSPTTFTVYPFESVTFYCANQNWWTVSVPPRQPSAGVRVVTAAGAVTVTEDDQVVIVKKTTGAATPVNLPAGKLGLQFTVKDGKADAATNNITITPAAGNIDGAATFVLSNNSGSWTGVYDGAQWETLSSR
jgi:hypothetical protein